MKPYYEHGGITIYHGDCREVLPMLSFDAVITDPVWPNAVPELAGADDPFGLFAESMRSLPESFRRVVVHLGCDSDPRFLSGVPDRFPFFRACWLEYARPHYKGRLLYTSDLAYVYGEPPRSRKGSHVIPGKTCNTKSSRRKTCHPCPRRLQHARWLVRWFADDGGFVDPFCGTGTCLEAAKIAGVPAVGIEVNEAYCEEAANRLRQEVLF